MSDDKYNFPDEVFAIWTGGRIQNMVFTDVFDEKTPRQKYVKDTRQAAPVDVEELAQEIRRIDGENSLGAGALGRSTYSIHHSERPFKMTKLLTDDIVEISIDAEIGSDPAEDAYWRFDARKNGHCEWKGRPQSERDAFKAEFNNLFAAAKTLMRTPPKADDHIPEVTKMVDVGAVLLRLKKKLVKQQEKCAREEPGEDYQKARRKWGETYAQIEAFELLQSYGLLSGVPDGYVVLSEVPTDETIAAMKEGYNYDGLGNDDDDADINSMKNAYKAMIAAGRK